MDNGGTIQLYDLIADKGETRHIASENLAEF